MSKTRINLQGERWCHHRKWKRVYESIDDAWMAAFGTFLACGAILVPYRCARMKLSIAVLGARRWRVRGCGFLAFDLQFEARPGGSKLDR